MTAQVFRPGEIRGRLPATRPRSVEHALSLLGFDYRSDFKGEHTFKAENLMCLCPFHDDRKESFSVSSWTGEWYCFACCVGGQLAKLAERICEVPRFMADRWAEGVDQAGPAWSLPACVAPEFVTYDEAEYRDNFSRPPRWALEEREISRAAASDLSIRWHRDRSAWVLPIRHPDHGGLLGWQYKTAERMWCHDGTPKSHSLFGIDVFEPGTTAILVESPLDVAVLLTADVDGGVASFGAGVSRTQLQLLAERASRIVLALDNDDAGRTGTEQVKASGELAGKLLLDFSYDHAPDAKDPGDMSGAEIKEALRTAKRVRR